MMCITIALWQYIAMVQPNALIAFVYIPAPHALKPLLNELPVLQRIYRRDVSNDTEWCAFMQHWPMFWFYGGGRCVLVHRVPHFPSFKVASAQNLLGSIIAKYIKA